jgi:hypothetical protein
VCLFFTLKWDGNTIFPRMGPTCTTLFSDSATKESKASSKWHKIYTFWMLLGGILQVKTGCRLDQWQPRKDVHMLMPLHTSSMVTYDTANVHLSIHCDIFSRPSAVSLQNTLMCYLSRFVSERYSFESRLMTSYPMYFVVFLSLPYYRKTFYYNIMI